MTAQPATLRPADTLRFDTPAMVRAALLAAAIIAVFWNLLDFIPPLGSLTYAWVNEEDWSHGPIIPLFSAYLVYSRWNQIRGCPVKYTWAGLPVLVAGILLYAWQIFGLLPFAYARDAALLLTILGVIIFMCGLPVMRYAWLPWAYLFFAIPIPKRYYLLLTDPLRRLAATVASAVLSLVPELHVERVGSNLEYTWHGVSGVIGVADACSGMRSTITLTALGVAVTFLADRPWWQRIIMIASCVPIATFCNFIRVTITCFLHIFVDPKYAQGTYHTALGLAIILLAFAIFSGVGRVLDHLVIDEDETPQAASG